MYICRNMYNFYDNSYIFRSRRCCNLAKQHTNNFLRYHQIHWIFWKELWGAEGMAGKRGGKGIREGGVCGRGRVGGGWRENGLQKQMFVRQQHVLYVLSMFVCERLVACMNESWNERKGHHLYLSWLLHVFYDWSICVMPQSMCHAS